MSSSLSLCNAAWHHYYDHHNKYGKQLFLTGPFPFDSIANSCICFGGDKREEDSDCNPLKGIFKIAKILLDFIAGYWSMKSKDFGSRLDIILNLSGPHCVGIKSWIFRMSESLAVIYRHNIEISTLESCS